MSEPLASQLCPSQDSELVLEVQLALMHFERDRLTYLSADGYPSKLALGLCTVLIEAIRDEVNLIRQHHKVLFLEILKNLRLAFTSIALASLELEVELVRMA